MAPLLDVQRALASPLVSGGTICFACRDTWVFYYFSGGTICFARRDTWVFYYFSSILLAIEL